MKKNILLFLVICTLSLFADSWSDLTEKEWKSIAIWDNRQDAPEEVYLFSFDKEKSVVILTTEIKGNVTQNEYRYDILDDVEIWIYDTNPEIPFIIFRELENRWDVFSPVLLTLDFGVIEEILPEK